VKPYYQDSAVTIYHGDCRQIVPELGSFDLLLTDPPYGVSANKMTLGTGKKEFFRGTDWDSSRPDITKYIGVANLIIIWGGNYFADALSINNDWLVWHKKNDGLSFSEVELAWTNLGKNTRIFSHNWSGEIKHHPTAKPLPLIKWCINIAGDVETILDPFAGSGTTGRAAKDLGRKAVLIELEEKYCEIAAQRMCQEVLFQKELF
jgi:site-specific DNA-methyltransferase (adenine-specific)